MTGKHSHYFKDVSGLKTVDIYRVLLLFSVTDPCLQHAAKKLLVAGGRGHKDITKDIQEAIDSLERWKAMRREDGQVDPFPMSELPPIPSSEELMGSIDPADAAYRWFTSVRNAVSDEWAFKGIVRHLLKSLETKLEPQPSTPCGHIPCEDAARFGARQ